MIDKNELEWGLRPLREIETVAVFGARTIFRNGTIEFLRDRQRFLGGEEPREALCNWINEKALPKLKEHIRQNNWSQSTEDVFSYEDWPFVLDCSPRGSGGYLYLSAYLKGFDELPKDREFQWSGDAIPRIGQTILCKVNRIGYATVLGYYIEAGWLGVIIWPNDPPDWYVRQNGKDALCGVFGAELGTNTKATEA